MTDGKEEGRNYIVGHAGDADFATIAAATESVRAGDVLTLLPGFYEEVVRVTSDVTLVALRDFCDEEEEEATETVIGNGVIILGNATLHKMQIKGRVDIRKGHAVLEGCDIYGGICGVRVGAGCTLTMKSCRVHHCSGAAGCDGVYFMPQSSGELENNDIYECAVNGLHVSGASVIARGNRIRDCMFGVYYRNGASGLVENNTMEHIKYFGMYVVQASDPVVRYNTVGECGIQCALVSEGGGGLWTENTFSGSMHVRAGCVARLKDNIVSDTLDIDSAPQIAASM